MYHQGYIEPHNGTAFWNQDGHLTVWTSTQGRFGCRQQLAQRPADAGVARSPWCRWRSAAASAASSGIYLEPLAALLSKKTGKPVKMTMTREEVFEATGPTSGTYIRVKIGAKKDGTLAAGEAYLAYEAGAFPGSPVGGGMNGVFAPYDIPNVADRRLRRRRQQARRPPPTARPARRPAMFAGEAVDQRAGRRARHGPDGPAPQERRQGGRRPAHAAASGAPSATSRCMEAMKNHPHYRSELQGENRGRGVAMGFWGNAGVRDQRQRQRQRRRHRQPRPRLRRHRRHARLAGHAAGRDAGHRRRGRPAPRSSTPTRVGFTGITGGSRTTFAGGWAAYELGHGDPQADGRARRQDLGVRRERRRPTATTASSAAPTTPRARTAQLHLQAARRPARPHRRHHRGRRQRQQDQRRARPSPATSSTSRSTGTPARSTILRYTAVQDVGTAIHPSYVEGQIQGGVAQGIGMALTEEYFYGADGRMRTPASSTTACRPRSTCR